MNTLNPSQAKQLREIAAYLKQKRIEQSLSLEQIASRTFIRLPMLEALETAQVEQLPELIYVQGFIRRYGEILHLDGNSLAKRLAQNESAVAVETPPQPQPKPQPQPQLKPKPEVRATETEASQKPSFQPYWPLIAIIGCIGASVGSLYALSRSPDPELGNKPVLPEISSSQQKTTPPTPVDLQVTRSPQYSPKATNSPVVVANSSDSTITQPSPVVTAPESTITQPSPPVAIISPSPVVTAPESTITQPSPPVATISPSPVITAPELTTTQPSPSPESSPVNPTTAPLSVAVALDGTSWLKIQVDGKTEYEGILEEGVKQAWTAKEKLTIIAGNAGAVSYSVNQKPAQRLGEPGEVKEIKLTPSINNTTP